MGYLHLFSANFEIRLRILKQIQKRMQAAEWCVFSIFDREILATLLCKFRDPSPFLEKKKKQCKPQSGVFSRSSIGRYLHLFSANFEIRLRFLKKKKIMQAAEWCFLDLRSGDTCISSLQISRSVSVFLKKKEKKLCKPQSGVFSIFDREILASRLCQFRDPSPFFEKKKNYASRRLMCFLDPRSG